MITLRIFMVLALTGLIHAQPAWHKDLSSTNFGKHERLKPCALVYDLSWKGLINSGNLRIEFTPPDAKKKNRYVVRSSAKSLGAAAALFPYESHYWSELNPQSLTPIYFHSLEKDNREEVTETLHYFPNRVTAIEEEKNLKTGVKKVREHTFEYGPVFDLFSAMLYIRSQELAVGDSLNFVICPFQTPYLMSIKVRAHEAHLGRDAIRLSVGMKKIDRETMALKEYKKLKADVTLWLSRDADRIPLEIRAPAWIGDVRAVLKQHQAF